MSAPQFEQEIRVVFLAGMNPRGRTYASVETGRPGLLSQQAKRHHQRDTKDQQGRMMAARRAPTAADPRA
jgi:hypothetical protein